MKKLSVMMAVLGLASTAEAADKVAVRSGDWNSTSTWGGAVPVPGRDDAKIPAGITVTVPAGTSMALAQGPDAGVLEVFGQLVVAGEAAMFELQIEVGGMVTTRPQSRIDVGMFLLNYGALSNHGRTTASFVLNEGAFLNESGATFAGSQLNFSKSTAVNRGTFENQGQFSGYGPFHNYGDIKSPAGRTFDLFAELRNLAGARILNQGALTVRPTGHIANDGTISHTGDYLRNDGTIMNSCSGRFVGQVSAGRPAQTSCGGFVSTPVVSAPSGAWSKVASGWTVVSARNANELVGVQEDKLVTSSSGRATPYSGLSGEIVQTSVGADGTWWAIDTHQGIHRMTSTGWSRVPGDLTQVSVRNANEVWGVNAYNAIWRWNGASWSNVPGQLVQVSVANDGTVWGIQPSQKIVMWNGTGWTTMPGEAVQVAVGSAGNVWVRNASGSVYRWLSGGWELVSAAGTCKGIAASADGAVFVLRADNQVYRK